MPTSGSPLPSAAGAIRSPRRLGLLLVLPPTDPRAIAALEWADQAMGRGDRVYVYGLDAGVRCLADARCQAWRARGVPLLGCALAARRHGVPLNTPATFGGIGLLHDVLAAVDRVVVAAPGSPPDRPLPSAGAGVVPPGPAHRRVVVLSAGIDAQTGSALPEALRVAAGLAAGQVLKVVLGIGQEALVQWPAEVDVGTQGADHLATFLDAGGRVWGVGVVGAGFPEAPAMTGVKPEDWAAELASAFAAIPF